MLVEEIIKTVTLYLAGIVEVIAALIIGMAALQALYQYMRSEFRQQQIQVSKEEIRLVLGTHLALSLEFLLAADILETAVAPTWNDIGQLAAIAVLRTALNYFLERELKAEKSKTPAKINLPEPAFYNHL
jgi:uncharacterized membrane protein